MNTITIELCAEDRARIDRLTKALEDQAPTTVHQEPLRAPEKVEPEQTEIVQAQEKEAPAPAVEPQAAPSVTKADVQRKVVELSAAGKKAEVREIVTEYATKVSGIPDDKVGEVWQRLAALEG